MTTLSPRTLVRNAAAVFPGCYGEVTRRAEQAGCSRQTVHDHARRVEQRLQPAAPAPTPAVAPVSTPAAPLDEATRRRLATTAFAMGVSTRQVEDLLRAILADDVPDHSTIGRWVADEAKKAQPVLAALDAAPAPRVRTLALDEIFLGGGRPSSGDRPGCPGPSGRATRRRRAARIGLGPGSRGAGPVRPRRPAQRPGPRRGGDRRGLEGPGRPGLGQGPQLPQGSTRPGVPGPDARRLESAGPRREWREAMAWRWWPLHRRPTAPDPPTSPARPARAVGRDRELGDEERASCDRVSAVPGDTIRASGAVECMNSALRVQQSRHKRMTQPMLDLKRLYWNCHRFRSGPRKESSPYRALGLDLPTFDFRALPQADPGELTQRPSTARNEG